MWMVDMEGHEWDKNTPGAPSGRRDTYMMADHEHT
jgi:hypothetical protein